MITKISRFFGVGSISYEQEKIKASEPQLRI